VIVQESNVVFSCIPLGAHNGFQGLAHGKINGCIRDPRVKIRSNDRASPLVMARLGVAIPVHVLRGGQIDNDYADALAAEAVIVGTLDQVVSRQLMRGYCCSRWSWPRHFAALNTDVRVVVDETQLQGAAVRTAIRLQELYQKLGGPAPRELVLCSAILDAAILPAGTPRHELSDADYGHPVAQRKLGRTKPLITATAGSNPCSPAAPRRPWRWR
jgi:hypothetical protein